MKNDIDHKVMFVLDVMWSHIQHLINNNIVSLDIVDEG